MSQETPNEKRRELRSVVKKELAKKIKVVFPYLEKPTTRTVEAVTWIAMPLVDRGMRTEKAVQMVLDRKDDYV